jgi:hypothetical protein
MLPVQQYAIEYRNMRLSFVCERAGSTPGKQYTCVGASLVE